MTNDFTIDYPLITISESKWNEARLLDYVLFEEYIYTDNLKIQQNVKAKIYCDCNGDIFTVKEITPPNQKWRIFFKFIPNVYKARIHFKKEPRYLGVEELRTYLINRISEFHEDEHQKQWISDLRSAKSHRGLINGTDD